MPSNYFEADVTVWPSSIVENFRNVFSECTDGAKAYAAPKYATVAHLSADQATTYRRLNRNCAAAHAVIRKIRQKIGESSLIDSIGGACGWWIDDDALDVIQPRIWPLVKARSCFFAAAISARRTQNTRF